MFRYGGGIQTGSDCYHHSELIGCGQINRISPYTDARNHSKVPRGVDHFTSKRIGANDCADGVS
jgi:hypothetical protein